MKRKPPLVLLATLGYPGSGKTFLSRLLARRLKYLHLCSDRMRVQIFRKRDYTSEEKKLAFRAMDYFSAELLSRGESLIYDGNATHAAYRKRLACIAHKYQAHFVLVWVQVSPQVALERLRMRRRYKSKLYKSFYHPLASDIVQRIGEDIEEPKHACVKVNGLMPAEDQINTVVKYLEKKKII